MIKRYDLNEEAFNPQDVSEVPLFVEREHGAFMRFSDHESEIASLKQQLKTAWDSGYIVSMGLLQSGASLDDEERAAVDAFVPYRKYKEPV